MILLLMRHGVAERGAVGTEDAERALTPDGRRRLEHAARAMTALLPEPARILCSPLRRARQTAEMLAREYGVAAETDRLLAPGARKEEVLELASRHADEPALLLIGHQPDLSMIVYDLCERDVHYDEGGVAAIELIDGWQKGQLQAFYRGEDLAARDVRSRSA